MTLGHYEYTNTNPNQPGYGEVIDIDVDALPKTDKPSNVQLPNMHIDKDTGVLYRCVVPNFYADPTTGQLYHSTNYGSK